MEEQEKIQRDIEEDEMQLGFSNAPIDAKMENPEEDEETPIDEVMMRREEEEDDETVMVPQRNVVQ